MSKQYMKSHNETILMYHLLYAINYRRDVLTDEVINTIGNVGLDITEKYGI